MYTSLKHKKVVTRTTHMCFGCYRKFPQGTEMFSWSGIYEGHFNNGYTCTTCDIIMKECHDDGDGFEEGFVLNMLNKGQTPEDLLIKT